MSQTIIVTFSPGQTEAVAGTALEQWAYGQRLQFAGLNLPAAYQVDFSNFEFCGDSIPRIGGADGVDVPVEVLTSGLSVYAFVWIQTQDAGRRQYRAMIRVIPGPLPSPEEPNPEEESVIGGLIASLNDAVEAAESAEENAQASETAAAGSAAEAAGSAVLAESWAVGGTGTRDGEDQNNAKFWAEEAGNAATEAEAAAAAAAESETGAGSAASVAAASATAAATAQTAAETAQGKAEDAQEAAEDAQAAAAQSATNAATAENNASTKAGEAAQSATSASGSAATATQKASEASASATAAAGSATSAGSAANAAASSATAAGNAQTAAETAQDKAEDAQEAAETAQNAAETAAASVAGSAAQIAQNTEDIVDLKSASTQTSDEVTDIRYTLGFDYIDVTATTIAGWSKLIVRDGITLEKGNTYRFSIYGESNNTRFLTLNNLSGTELARWNATYDGYIDYTPTETLTNCYLDYRSNIANATAKITGQKITKSYDGLYSQFPQIIIGSEIVGVVGDTLQLFFSNFITGDMSEYVIECSCDIGKNYPAYYEVTPTSSNVGNHTLTISIYLNNGSIYTTKTVNLKVVAATNPSSSKHILCLGDSRMWMGQIPIEASRRLKATAGVATSPEPLNLQNFDFVGRLSNDTNTVYWEGVPGHTWTSYMVKNTNNPFYYSDTDTVDFARYAEDYCGGEIDVFCILLGINTIMFANPFGGYNNLLTYIANMLSTIHAQLPNSKIIVSTEPCDSPYGGIGSNYNADASTGKFNSYGFNYRVLNYDKELIEYFENNTDFDYVTVASSHAQFQCEYAFPTTEKAVNTRSTVMETLQNNGIHPNNTGYWQLSDAFVFRALLGLGL